MTFGVPDRRTVRRHSLLAVDLVLTRIERLWVDVAGGARGLRDRRRLDPATGRTSLGVLREGARTDEDLWSRVQEALAGGAPPDDVRSRLDSALDRASDAMVATLHGRAPQMLRDRRAIQRGMQRRLRALWGPALDAFYEIYVCVEEIGSDVQQLHGGSGDPLIEALLGLHARSSLLLVEIHALMARGFPFGAWARTRSLHETAVLATVLSEHGRRPGTEDLAERFLQHAVVDEARDLELAVDSGLEVDDEELAAVQEARGAVVERYGSMFAKDYGWARPLFRALRPRQRVTFEALERLAGSGLDRLDYRLGGHHVHSSAWSVVLNSLERGGTVYRVTGPTNVGFGDPASVALHTTLVSTSALFAAIPGAPRPMALVGMRVLQMLAKRAVELFAEGQALVDQREAGLRRQEER